MTHLLIYAYAYIYIYIYIYMYIYIHIQIVPTIAHVTRDIKIKKKIADTEMTPI